MKQHEMKALIDTVTDIAWTHTCDKTTLREDIANALLPVLPADRCELPPKGWRCQRMGGHTGPCAAVPDSAALIADTVVEYHRKMQDIISRARDFDSAGMGVLVDELVDELQKVNDEYSPNK